MADGSSQPGGPTSEDVEGVIRNELVAVAVEQLSETHRAVLRETYLHRHTVGEAASRLGLPADTVKARVHFALRALRNALAELSTDGLETQQ